MFKIGDIVYLTAITEEDASHGRYEGEMGIFQCYNDESGENGYIDLHCGYEAENDINYFVNREYVGYNFENDDGHIWLEMYDTINFYMLFIIYLSMF